MSDSMIKVLIESYQERIDFHQKQYRELNDYAGKDFFFAVAYSTALTMLTAAINADKDLHPDRV